MIKITSFYAALLTIFYFYLVMRVVKSRWDEKVALGTGNSKILLKRVRIHGNFIENIPLSLILLAMIEIQKLTSPLILHIFGTILILTRLLHNIGLTKSIGTSFGRFVGTSLNQILNLAFSFILLYNYLNE